MRLLQRAASARTEQSRIVYDANSSSSLAVVSADCVWTVQEGALHLMLAKSDKSFWGRLFPQEERMAITDAIKSVHEDDDDEGRLSYMELTPEARGLVDLHRSHRHARATGKEAWAADLEEEMKMMQFRWGDG